MNGVTFPSSGSLSSLSEYSNSPRPSYVEELSDSDDDDYEPTIHSLIYEIDACSSRSECVRKVARPMASLIEAGTDLNTQDDSGQTPLTLLALKIIETQNYQSYTDLQGALKFIARQSGCDKSVTNSEGDTAYTLFEKALSNHRTCSPLIFQEEGSPDQDIKLEALKFLLDFVKP